MDDEQQNRKRAIRAELRERRRNRTATERETATDAITARLTELTTQHGAVSIAAYLSAPDEPNIRPYLNWANNAGIRVLLPVSRDDGLLDWVVDDGESETEGPYGMPEAVGDVLGPIAINDVDLIIVPAASVDRHGMRMGWGRGYYDRMLGSMQQCPPVYAVVFDNELVDSVPTELHDKGVNGVITPGETATFDPA